MLENNYGVYVSEIISLVKSIVLKSTSTADLINTGLEMSGVYVDHNDPTTWKYYLNLSGQYHAADTAITLISSDTQTEMVLNRTNILASPITAIEYSPGGIYHKKLLDDNPGMDIFINGVFDPVDINTAVAAKNHTILSYDRKYVASNESDLMRDVREWVVRYFMRWHIEDYQLADELYLASMYAVFFNRMILEIINIRIKYCNTPQVCQFHLWSKLKGHYSLDEFKPYLSIQQSLYLYRNIEHIEMYAGKERLLVDMLEHLALPRNLIAQKFDFLKDESGMLTNKRALGRYVRQDYDDNDLDLNEDRALEERSILYETKDKAALNQEELDADVQRLAKLGDTMYYDNIPTGLVKIIPDNNIVGELLDDTQLKMDYWAYLANANLYTGIVTFEFPGYAPINVSARDALVLYIYAASRVAGRELETIPSIVVRDVVRVTPPATNVLRDLAPADAVSDDDITEALADLIAPATVNNVEELELFVDSVINRRVRHDLQWNGKLNHIHSSYMKDIVSGAYNSYELDLYPVGYNYNTWFEAIRFSKFGIGDFEWYTIALTILEQMTGIIPGETSMPAKQRAVVDILDRLTSYSVIITKGETEAGYLPLDFPFISPDGGGDCIIESGYLEAGHLLYETELLHNVTTADTEELDLSGVIVILPDYHEEVEELGQGLTLEVIRATEYNANITLGGLLLSDLEIEAS